MNRYINESDKKMDELLQKYIAGNASEKESQRIMEWLREDEQHLREYKRQRKLYRRRVFNLHFISAATISV